MVWHELFAFATPTRRVRSGHGGTGCASAAVARSTTLALRHYATAVRAQGADTQDAGDARLPRGRHARHHRRRALRDVDSAVDLLGCSVARSTSPYPQI